MLYLIMRYDCDNDENHFPEYMTIFGVCENYKDAEMYIKALEGSCYKYNGYNGKDYPRFLIKPLPVLDLKKQYNSQYGCDYDIELLLYGYTYIKKEK